MRGWEEGGAVQERVGGGWGCAGEGGAVQERWEEGAAVQERVGGGWGW